MDATRLGSGQPTVMLPDMNILDVSEDESDVDDAHLTLHPRVNGVNGTHDLDALEASEGEYDSDDGWEADSIYEDTIEEMGDEHLFDGGEYLATPY
jgi:hypothetical protein